MFSYESWEQEFKPKLGHTKRWDGFSYIARDLSRRQTLRIIETGCTRSPNDWEGAGASTLIWDWMQLHAPSGSVYSLELNENNLHFASTLTDHVQFVLGDSIESLCTFRNDGVLASLDLLYLDSYDHNPPYGPSELHAAGELACCWDNLPRGSLIAVDDCNPDGTGKHHLIKKFFERMGIPPILDGYMHVWRKP